MSPAPARKERSRAERPKAPTPDPRPCAAVALRDSSPVAYHLVWVTMLILLVAGMCMMLSVSVAEAFSGGDKYGYVRTQGIAAAVGLVLLMILWRLDYPRLRVISVAFLVAVGFLLILVHIPQFGQSVGGAKSYLKIGPFTLQPSEFAKLALVLLGAHLLSGRRAQAGDLKAFMWPFGVIGVVLCGMVTLEGDLGTAIIMAGLLMGMLWMGGMKATHWLAVTGVGATAAMALVFTNNERMSRVFSFLDPSADPQGSAYQLGQSLVALGRGGWIGVGPGESIQKFQYLPKAHTDMIFSILGEEFGLLGAGSVLVLFGVFAFACWRLARRCSDPMGKYLIAGCSMLVTLQAVVNIGGVIGALPLTGVPLPFISYGRSSLVAMLMAVGVILAVARRAPARPAPSPAVRYENVTRIDRGRRDRGTRGARPSPR
ncbi:MAG: putative lipid II flippase FtsW [Thermoleophilia bacterium]|nr:putative lipid II flippase FtsW [Thermoleophilia bacterium]